MFYRIEDELKVKYDDAVRIAKKLFQGNSFVKAAEKYKEVCCYDHFIFSLAYRWSCMVTTGN